MNGGMILLEVDYSSILQMAPLHALRCAYTRGSICPLLYDGKFQSLQERSNHNNEHTSDYCKWNLTHTEVIDTASHVFHYSILTIDKAMFEFPTPLSY